MSRRILGIDICKEALTAVMVRSRLKGSSIENHLRIAIDRQKPFMEEAARALAAVSREMDLNGAVCVAALPAQEVSFRNLRVPFPEKKKIRQVLPFELEALIPFGEQDVVIDFDIVHTEETTRETEIIAAAAEKSLIKSYLDLFGAVDLNPDVITVRGFALAKTLAHVSEQHAASLILDAGRRHATLLLLLSQRVALVRSIPVRADAADGGQRLAKYVRQTLTGYERLSGRRLNLERVYTTGVAFAKSEFAADLAEKMGISLRPVDLMENSEGISIDGRGKLWDPFAMDATLSLALSDIAGIELLNFRQGAFAEKKAWMEYRFDILKTGALALVVLALFLTHTIFDYFTMKAKAARVNQEIHQIFRSTFPAVTRVVDPLQQMRVKIEEVKDQELFHGETEREVKAIDILNDISTFIPKGMNVELVSIIIGSDSVLISGSTDTFNSVDDMKNGLARAASFSSVSISSANMERSGNRVRFKLKAVV